MKRKILIYILALIMLCAPILGACAASNFPSVGDIFETEDNRADKEITQEEKLKEGSDTQEEESPSSSQQDTYIRSLTAGLNIRAGAGTNYAVLGAMDKGSLLPYVGSEEGWFVTYYKGKKAFVSKSYAALFTMEKSLNQSVEEVLIAAKGLLGYAYIYGAVRYHNGSGKLLSGFVQTQYDCSSLTQYAFYKGAGICLGLTTREQILQGVYINAENIKRGDLLFFTNASRKNLTGINRVGHVAIYLGNNYILHTASDFAVIEEISSLRWSYFIEARRVI